MGVKERHVPQRTCLGCGARDDQAVMIRLAASEDGQVKLEAKQGRGGYLHRTEDCWKKFVSRKSHFRAFHREVGKAAKEALVQQLKAWDRE